ncbi:response regulator [Planctobacterium marinum]|uniref:Response regulatory domain-containing protein n=1 Tax=Planctobacterium marinum TaxID=1631968 RepID=A0AA48HNI2_9ALTE|nr:hypothetical protein MACH26_12930 [Planctobacterium marinum]
MQIVNPGPVLVVEKSGMMMSVIVTLLHELRFDNIVRVIDANSALEKLETIHFTLVICDWYDKSNDMLNLIHHIRNSPRSTEVPIVMVSGIIDHADVEQAIALGITEYIVKPFTLELFEEKVQHAMASSSANPKRIRKVQPEDATEFTSKVVLCVENKDWQRVSLSVLQHLEVECTTTLANAIVAIKKDKQFDVVIIDESGASHNREDMQSLLKLVQLGQVDIILLSDNTNKLHRDSIKKLGIKHVVNPVIYAEDLVTNIEMMSKLKQAMLHINRTVRKAELKKRQNTELQSLLTGSVKQRASNINSLSEQLTSKSKGSQFVANLAKEIKSDAITIDSYTDALNAMASQDSNIVVPTKEGMRMANTIATARTIFAKELAERDITIEFEEQELLSFQANPILFNSLFMFICKSLIVEIVYSDILHITASPSENTDEILVTISAKIAGFPKLTYLAERVSPKQDGTISIIYKEAIKHLLDSQLSDLQANYNRKQSILNLYLSIKSSSQYGTTEAEPT